MAKEMIWKDKNADIKKCFEFCEDYRRFISENKTERECVAAMIKDLKTAGAVELKELIESGRAPKENELVYTDMMKKALIVFRTGRRPVTDGLRVLGAHIDSPRIDIKQNPFYEDHELAYFDTHYYGGIKKYQWTARPLALHGVVVKKDGTTVNIVVGEDENSPVIGISDLLPHLSKDQNEKKLAEAIPGEKLDILIGSIPMEDCEKEAVKAAVLKLLKEEYNIEEEDFTSAEIEAVPAGAARDYGLDRSMILGYGQDDRVCGYTSFKAIMEEEDPEFTSVCLLVDKEEIGSVGATGMQSRFFEDTVADFMDVCGCFSPIALRRTLRSSKVLSSDVSAGFDPCYPEVMVPTSACYLGYGPVFNKFTGARGKSGSNDANPEYIAYLRNIMDNAGIKYQYAELGKVDQGGGGTIAYILANLTMEVIDFGVSVLNMHAPCEVTSKADIYEAYRAYRVFLR